MKKYWILAVCFLILCAVFSVIAVRRSRGETIFLERDPDSVRDYVAFLPDTADAEPLPPITEPVETEIPAAVTEEPMNTEAEETEAETETEEITEAPIDPPKEETQKQQSSVLPAHSRSALMDFSYLQKVNPEIYAYLDIAGTTVSYPILQSAADDQKYLTTAYDGSYYVGGSIFTEHTYNGKDFSDPVTMVYGHYMKSGKLFGSLQSIYSDKTSFDEHSEITVYIPGDVKYYRVFAAVPFETFHILATYDFSNRYWYQQFFRRISEIEAPGANFDPDITPEPEDHILILSTCENGDSSGRFLVIAILEDDLPVSDGN